MKKNFFKQLTGVTLLEIMLVMAIAAGVILMAVRYYQSATTARQVNTMLDQVNGIIGAVDGLMQANGSYISALAAGASATLVPLLPKGSLLTPWSTPITVAAVSSSSLSITIAATPSAVCRLLRADLAANSHFTNLSTCSASPANFVATYSN